MPAPKESVSVLIVDDSSSQRAALAKGLKRSGIQVMGGAADAYMARDLIFKLSPQVMTLDLQMPGMDGLTFLSRLMAYKPMPVVVLSALTATHQDLALRALELGAVEVCPKPSGLDLEAEMKRLAAAIRRAGRSQPRSLSALAAQPLASQGALDLNRIVAIGASTGGTTALAALLPSLPADYPPLLVVQHMPTGFTGPFAARLDSLCRIRVREAKDGDAVLPGFALLAPAGLQMRLERGPTGLRVRCFEGGRKNYVAPSVDVLFHSVAETMGSQALGVLLTGMGKDGAEGLLALRQAGAHCLAQDEASSVIWGMPGEAVKCGAAEEAVPLAQMAQKMASLLKPDNL